MVLELSKILITAVLTAALTWGIAWAFFRARVRDELSTLRERIGDEVEQRVYQGAVRAGNELLPGFRAEVERGFKDALLSTARGDLMEEAAKTVAERGAEIVGSILGRGKPRP